MAVGFNVADSVNFFIQRRGAPDLLDEVAAFEKLHATAPVRLQLAAECKRSFFPAIGSS